MNKALIGIVLVCITIVNQSCNDTKVQDITQIKVNPKSGKTLEPKPVTCSKDTIQEAIPGESTSLLSYFIKHMKDEYKAKMYRIDSLEHYERGKLVVEIYTYTILDATKRHHSILFSKNYDTTNVDGFSETCKKSKID